MLETYVTISYSSRTPLKFQEEDIDSRTLIEKYRHSQPSSRDVQWLQKHEKVAAVKNQPLCGGGFKSKLN